MHTGTLRFLTVAALTLAVALVASPTEVRAHCDSLDGPVILAAKTALEQAEVTPVLKWVRPADEAEISTAFRHTLTVRTLGPEARELADHYFFETLVRVHRAGEGAPYTGLRTSVAEAGPAVVGADQALESGSVDALVHLVSAAVGQGMRERFQHALELRKHADHNLEAGRQYVAAYVDYVHYVEGVYAAAAKAAGHHDAAEHSASAHGKHAH